MGEEEVAEVVEEAVVVVAVEERTTKQNTVDVPKVAVHPPTDLSKTRAAIMEVPSPLVAYHPAIWNDCYVLLTGNLIRVTRYEWLFY